MSATGWRDLVVNYIRDAAQPVDKFGHQPRLYALTLELGKNIDYDDDVVFAAAWMHDLGIFIGHRPEDIQALAEWNHIQYTIERTQELLPAWGFPGAKLEAVAEVIKTHQPNERPQTVEGMLVHDADILEQLGAIAVVRAFAKVGRDTRYRDFSSVLEVLRKALRDLPDMLCLSQSMQLAKPRAASLQEFIAALEFEAGDLLF
ncbi:MAG: HD domain-containing protein [Acidobacteriota bacterium]|nr:HD domain-containing protein [Acidobacteriota bacterium]